MDRFDLGKYMKVKHQVTGAYWDDDSGLWEVHVKDLLTGDTFIDRAEVFVNASGILK